MYAYMSGPTMALTRRDDGLTRCEMGGVGGPAVVAAPSRAPSAPFNEQALSDALRATIPGMVDVGGFEMVADGIRFADSAGGIKGLLRFKGFLVELDDGRKLGHLIRAFDLEEKISFLNRNLPQDGLFECFIKSEMEATLTGKPPYTDHNVKVHNMCTNALYAVVNGPIRGSEKVKSASDVKSLMAVIGRGMDTFAAEEFGITLNVVANNLDVMKDRRHMKARRPFMRLRDEMLRTAKGDKLRKLGTNVWRPVEGCMYAYLEGESFREFINATLDDTKEFHSRTTHYDELHDYLLKYNPKDIRDMVFDRDMLSFRDGVVVTSPDRPEIRFVRYDDPAVLTLSKKIARHHIDHEYLANVGAPTPLFDGLLAEQFPPDVVHVLLILLGRLLFPVGQYDNWQVFPWLLGTSGTGKSILSVIVAAMFARAMTGTLSGNAEQVFGLEGKYECHVILGRDLPHGMSKKLPQDLLQSMVSGERISVPRKGRVALDVSWTAPILFASNNYPDYTDSNGQIVRRMVPFAFRQPVVAPDPTLCERIMATELPAIYDRIVKAYFDAVKAHRAVGFWTWAPHALLVAQNEAAVATNHFRRFLALGPDDKGAEVAPGLRVYTRDERGVFTSMKALNDAFSAYMERNHRGVKVEPIDKAAVVLAGYTYETDKNTCSSCHRAVSGGRKLRCCPNYLHANRKKVTVVGGLSLVTSSDLDGVEGGYVSIYEVFRIAKKINEERSRDKNQNKTTQSKSEKLFGDALESCTGIIFERNTRPTWVVNPVTGVLMELDLYCADKKLAIEYDGEHHYDFPNRYHDSREEFEAQQARDRAKDRLCAERGVKLIRIKCLGLSRTDDEVRECIARLTDAGLLS